MLSSLQHVFHIVIPPFLIIILGFGYNRWARVSTEMLVNTTMRLFVPAFAFVYIINMKVDTGIVSSVLISAWIMMIGTGLLAFALFRLFSIQHRGLYLPIMFMNTVNLPFPILLSAYGDKVLAYCLMFYIAQIFGAFTVGIMLVSKGNGLQQMFKEPVLYVLVAAFTIKATGLPVPSLVIQSADLLASATIALVLLALGMELAQVQLSQIRLSLFAAFCRIAGGLAMAALCVSLLQLEGLARKVVLFNGIMPAAVISYLIAQKYDADGSLVASTVLVSTIISALIIPLMLLYLG